MSNKSLLFIAWMLFCIVNILNFLTVVINWNKELYIKKIILSRILKGDIKQQFKKLILLKCLLKPFYTDFIYNFNLIPHIVW